MMSRRERLRRAYFHEEMDRPAVYTRSGYPGNDPTYDKLKALMAAESGLKLIWDTEHLHAAVPMTDRTVPYNDDFDKWISEIKTPKGVLTQEYLVSRKGQPGLHLSHFIKTRTDAEACLSLPAPAPAGDVDGFYKAEKEVGDTGITDVCLGSNPAGAVVDMCGSENFAFMSVTDRDVLHALMERRMRLMLDRVKRLVKQKVGPFFSMLGEEYIVPPLHGPADFEDFNVRYDKPVIDLVHEAGGRMHIHSHGRVKTVLDGFLRMGVDVLHPLEPPMMGDVTPAEAKAALKGRVTIEGNIQIADMYEKGPEAIRAHTAALIGDAFGDRRGLIVAPTASPYLRGLGEKCYPQYQAMVEAVKNWKRP
ncbi:MAG: uroporphyrinogen decarboxylase family protein [Planctomycetota bacterium]